MAQGRAWRGFVAGALALFAVPVSAADSVLAVPSGQPVTFQEVLQEAAVYRFRFVAPQIGAAGREYEDVERDMQHLCESYALPRLPEGDAQPDQIVISLSQSESEFGVADPEIVQYFEAYRVENETCILEFF
ncbi:DUF6497 family protein [Marivita sp. S2033]|uniref:DUF6497 family protein n=1 Tax=Marivita sp. S2033 TaxID=3373187 RepID=UPI0039828083